MEPNNTSTSFKNRLWILFENVIYIGCAIGLALLIQAYIARPFIVSGSSMDPVIKNGEYMIIDEISYRFREPQRGDVVVFKSPPEPNKFYIKRLIGLPGDTIKIDGSVIIITNKENPDGFILHEPFITHKGKDKINVVVPPNKYYVLGDNRSGSYDSRTWGTVPRDYIRGRALLRLLPLSTIDYLPGKESYE